MALQRKIAPWDGINASAQTDVATMQWCNRDAICRCIAIQKAEAGSSSVHLMVGTTAQRVVSCRGDPHRARRSSTRKDCRPAVSDHL